MYTLQTPIGGGGGGGGGGELAALPHTLAGREIGALLSVSFVICCVTCACCVCVCVCVCVQ